VCRSSFEPGRGEIDINHNFALVRHWTFDLYTLQIPQSRNPTRQIQETLQGRAWVKFINGWPLHIAGHPGNPANKRYQNGVPRLQSHILALVALQEQVIEIEGMDLPAPSHQLDTPQRTVFRGATRGKQCVNNGRERTDCIGARLSHLPYHVDQNSPQFA